MSYYEIRENPDNSHDPTVDWPTNSAVTASSFMGKLRAKTGLATFDLPTEAQWEYACRAGTTHALNSGYNLTDKNDDARMAAVGRYHSATSDWSIGTATVGSYLPNAWGLYDMHGNVWERCLDWWEPYYAGSSTQDPGGPASDRESHRVSRGGGWKNDAAYCRSASRYYNYPYQRSSFSGFRAAMTLP